MDYLVALQRDCELKDALHGLTPISGARGAMHVVESHHILPRFIMTPWMAGHHLKGSNCQLRLTRVSWPMR